MNLTFFIHFIRQTHKISSLQKITYLIALIGIFIGITTYTKAQEKDLSMTKLNLLVKEQLAESRVPGIALAIVQEEHMTYRRGYGVTNEGQPSTSLTQYQIGSLSKIFTAIAVMQLVEDGKIDLDATTTNYLPELEFANNAEITVRQLLHHTSGLSDASFNPERFRQIDSLEAQVNALNGIRLTREPDTFAYTDLNDAILGRIIEVVANTTYPDYLQANIFDPLGMTATTTTNAFLGKPTETHILIFGFPYQYHEGANVGAVSARGIISTSEDMSRLLYIFINGGNYKEATILSPESIERIFTPPEGSNYAMGWYLFDHPDYGTIYQHTSNLRSYHADIAIMPIVESGFVTTYNANNLFLHFTTFATINDSIINLLDERDPIEGLSLRTVSIVLCIILGISIIGDLYKLIRLPQWATKHATKPITKLLPGMIWTLLPLIILIALPQLIMWFMGRAMSYSALFAFSPELIGWLAILAASSIIQVSGQLSFHLYYEKKDSKITIESTVKN